MANVLRSDRWKLDFVAIIVFAISMAAIFWVVGNSGPKNWIRIVPAIGIALFAYSGTFVVGLILRNRVPLVRSWVWISIGGALMHTLILLFTIAIPQWIDHFDEFFLDSEVTKSDYLIGHIPLVALYFVVWGTSGAVFLVLTRFVDNLIAGWRGQMNDL